ncbi:complex I NDUFA9 subunit family protein [Craterilacuibacter sp.]|uniref:complex I NDUFA9 subunit family protein n=1 Tax=Craterilacuibacter sp. TaxID=2870909 RepID=UPI003F35BEC5
MQSIVLIGGSGFVGRHIAEALTAQGMRLTIACRSPERVKALTTLPGVELQPCDVHDPAALARLIAGHDAVISMVGILHGSRQAFETAHVALVEKIIHAMKQTGRKRLIHLSALGADEHGPSDYQQTKARGERAIMQSGLDYTILRPSVIFARDDNFLNMFARLLAVLPVLPLAGADTRFAPVWADDVAQAVAACLTKRATIGQTLELAGPHRYRLRELVAYVGELTGHPRTLIGLPMPLAMLQAGVMECLPGPTLISRDNVRSLSVDNVSLQPFPAELLGFTPHALEAVAPGWLGAEERNARLARWRGH